jgi:hypothetical protein
MKALLLTLMFLISMTAFCQQKSSREVGVTVLKDSSNILKDCSIVVSKENLMLSQSVIVDHHALAKKYKSTSGYYAIAAVAFGVAGYGCYKSLSDKLSETVAAIGTVCFGVAIGCTIAAVVYHHKAGKELKLSVKGATACLVYTF